MSACLWVAIGGLSEALSRELGELTRELSRFLDPRLKMAHEDLVCPPSVSACDHQARFGQLLNLVPVDIGEAGIEHRRLLVPIAGQIDEPRLALF